MEDESRRRVLKYFKCNKCRKYVKQLVHPLGFKINCENCGKYLSDVSETEYKAYQKKNSSQMHMSSNEPIRPNIQFNNVSDAYRRPPSNLNNRRTNPRETPRQSNRRYASSHHYSNDYSGNNTNTRSNVNSQNNYNGTNSNFANFAYNNIFNSNNGNYNSGNMNINNSNNNNNGGTASFIRRNNFDERTGNEGMRRSRDRSVNPNILQMNPLNDFINNFFAEIPLFHRGNMNIGQPYTISFSLGNNNGLDDIFDPIFISFGSSFDNIFRNNFFSNFRSTMSDNIYAQFINSIRQQQEEAERQRHHPTQKEALNKLKKFKMSEKYCKKNNKGKLELPNCCICISDINKGEETVLLPCGHMFHWKCCYSWLKENNTCPVCRFELPKER